jgi:hypothetical protein
MHPVASFLGSFGVTLVLLGLVVASGRRGRVRPHLTFVASAVLSLGVTIFFAERLGDHYDLESAGAITPVHLFLAKVATLSYLAPVVTGWRTLRDRRHKRVHLWVAMTVLALTVLTAATGTAMVWMSDPLPSAPG